MQATLSRNTPGLLATRTWAIPLAVIWVVAFAAGLVGMAERISEGHRPADYGSYLTWGLWVAVYQYLIEMAAGAFILAAAIHVLRLKALERVVPVALLLSVVALVAGILAVWVDLGRMERFWRVIVHPNFSSLIAWVVVAYTAFVIVALVALWFALRPALVRAAGRGGWQGQVASVLKLGASGLDDASLNRDRNVLRVLLLLGLVPAIGFSGGEGALFGVVGARPYWNSPVFPIAFLASSVVTAAAVLTVLAAFFMPRGESTRGEVTSLARLMVVALAALLLLQFADYTVAAYASIPAQRDAMDEVLMGDYWWNFWLVQLIGGAAVPIAIMLVRGKSPLWLGIAAFFAAAGMMSLRLNAVIPGQILPQLEGIETAFVDDRLTFDYFPSAMEWLVTLFIASVGVLLFYIGYRALPMAGGAEAPGGAAEGGK